MSRQQYSLTLDEFRALAAEGNLIPLYREILADYETPVSAFAKIDHGPTAYLLESVAGGENWARYSFLGSGSSAVIREEKGDLVLIRKMTYFYFEYFLKFDQYLFQGLMTHLY